MVRAIVVLCLVVVCAPSARADITRPDSSKGKTRAGLREGEWTFFRELDGGRPQLVARGEYRHGKKHGTWTYWHRPGVRRSVVECRDGTPHGWYRTWNDEGRPVLVGRYDHGRMTGTWTEASGGGRLVGRYRLGERIAGDPVDLCEADSCNEGDDGLLDCMPFGDDGEVW